jgi:hypothetical protein
MIRKYRVLQLIEKLKLSNICILTNNNLAFANITQDI